MRLMIPKLRTWHLLGLVAASAGFFSVMQYRWGVYDHGFDLVRRLRSLNASERVKAAEGLGSSRPLDRRAFDPLAEMVVSDPDARARASAARALVLVDDNRPGRDPAEVERARAVLATALGDRDPVARREIAVALARLQPEPKAVVPALLGLAGEADPEGRGEVISALSLYARRDDSARATTLAAMGDRDWRVRWQAIRGLTGCAVYPPGAPPSFVAEVATAIEAAIHDESKVIRIEVVFALGRLGNAGRVENPRLVEALGDPDADVRLQAANWLAWKGLLKRSEAVVPALVRALADKNAGVRRACATTLGKIGLDAESAIPALRGPEANDPDADVRQAARLAIGEIQVECQRSQAGIPLNPRARLSYEKGLAELADADPAVRGLAVTRLGDIGPSAAGAVPALVRSLADGEAEVRRASAAALGQLGPGAAVAVPALEKLAESDPDELVRRAAAESRAILARDPGGGARVP